MMSRRFPWSCLLLLLGSVACSSLPEPASGRVPASLTKEKLAQRLASDLSSNVIEIPRAFFVYHYVSRSGDLRLAPAEIDRFGADEARTHLAQWSEWFFNPAQPRRGEDAQGLYAALEPLSSRAWGKEDWVLMRFEIPKGTRILDLNGSLKAQPSVHSKLQKHVFDLYSVCPGDISARNLFMKTVAPACRQFFSDLLRSMGVDAILYGPWRSAQFPKHCEKVKDASLLVLNTEGISKEGIRIFRDARPAEDQMAEAKVFEGLRRINPVRGMTYDDKMKAYNRLWAEGKIPAADKSEIEAYLAKHILGCQVDGGVPDDRVSQ